jgi:hypothetical protein
MKVNVNDYNTIYTADQDYDGPEGTILKGERFRISKSDMELADDLVLISLVDDDYDMSIRHEDGVLISD